MGSEGTFQVVLEGCKGDKGRFRTGLIRMGMKAEQADRVLQAMPCVLKRHLKLVDAERYKAAFRGAGGDVVVKAEGPVPGPAPAAEPLAAREPTAAVLPLIAPPSEPPAPSHFDDLVAPAPMPPVVAAFDLGSMPLLELGDPAPEPSLELPSVAALSSANAFEPPQDEALEELQLAAPTPAPAPTPTPTPAPTPTPTPTPAPGSAPRPQPGRPALVRPGVVPSPAPFGQKPPAVWVENTTNPWIMRSIVSGVFLAILFAGVSCLSTYKAADRVHQFSVFVRGDMQQALMLAAREKRGNANSEDVRALVESYAARAKVRVSIIDIIESPIEVTVMRGPGGPGYYEGGGMGQGVARCVVSAPPEIERLNMDQKLEWAQFLQGGGCDVPRFVVGFRAEVTARFGFKNSSAVVEHVAFLWAYEKVDAATAPPAEP